LSYNLPVIIIGAGGHAKVLAGLLDAAGTTIAGLVDADAARHGVNVLAHRVLGGDDVIENHTADTVELVVGVGSTRAQNKRKEIFAAYARRGYTFHTCIHPAATIAADAEISPGAQIMAGAIIQPGAVIGANTIINTGACIDHDCHIGDHAHIAPGAVLCGGVTVGACTHIGAASVILQNIAIGDDTTIGAGAVVTSDVRDGACMTGIPARDAKHV